MILCQRCKTPYPSTGSPFRCQECGGDFESDTLPQVDFSCIEEDQPGIWRFRHSFFEDGLPVISLGEGNTPLISLDETQGVFGKLEYLNPTGSYKDRAMSLILSHVLKRGADSAVEDSSGNAGASFAAYAARAGINARVFVPEHTSPAKINQIAIYGAEVNVINGPRAAAAAAVLKEAENGAVYASHAYLPFGLPGIATIAYELFFQLNKTVPGSVVVPVGHGHLLRGILDGFLALKEQGYLSDLPYFVGVQAERCAPISTAWEHHKSVISPVETVPTIAEGTAVTTPRQGNALLTLFSRISGEFMSISEAEIFEGFHALASRGVYVEPTSALVWAALQRCEERLPKPVILVLTGNGLKYTIEH